MEITNYREPALSPIRFMMPGLSFPIEVGLDRHIAPNMGAYIDYVESCIANKEDCYVALFSQAMVGLKAVDAILLDIDGGYDDMQAVWFLLNEAGLEGVWYYTGRGYHCYLLFQTVVMKDYGQRCRQWAKKIGIWDMIDKKVIGDRRRMRRVHHTQNSKTGRWMVRIDPKMSEQDIVRCSEMNTSVDFDPDFSYTRLEQELLSLEVPKDRQRRVTHLIGKDNYPPCIEKCIYQLVKDGELSHEGRLLLATYFLPRIGRTGLKILFSCANDYDVNKTEYQLLWLEENNYQPYSCKRLKEMGLCPHLCECYPWLGKRE